MQTTVEIVEVGSCKCCGAAIPGFVIQNTFTKLYYGKGENGVWISHTKEMTIMSTFEDAVKLAQKAGFVVKNLPDPQVS